MQLPHSFIATSDDPTSDRSWCC